MVFYKTDEEIEQIRNSCILVSEVLAQVASRLKEGVTGEELDKVAETYIKDHQAMPAFKGYGGFPSTLCISINEAVVHGIPNDKPFRSGDVISVDCGVKLNGFFGDSAYTFALGEVSQEAMALLSATKRSLYKGIEQAIEGKRLGDLGYAIQEYCEKQRNYGVVRDLVGHGIGRSLHESPEVPNYGKRGDGMKLKSGLVIAIEPMVNMGKREVQKLKDGWTIVTKDRKPSAHFEHTVAVRKNQADILSNHEIIEKEIKNNAEIREIQ